MIWFAVMINLSVWFPFPVYWWKKIDKNLGQYEVWKTDLFCFVRYEFGKFET